MARGDFVKINYRTGAGVASEEIEAMTAGAKIIILMPQRGELHVTVMEINQADAAVRTARFLASEVLSIVEAKRAAQKIVQKKA